MPPRWRIREIGMSEEATPAGSQPPAPFIPRWWLAVVVLGVCSSFVVSLVERAASHLVLAFTLFVAVVLLLLRHLRRGRGTVFVRMIPLIVFLGLLCAGAATVRIDDISGNLIPTRISFRWQLQRDERLTIPAPTASATGIDLATQSAFDFPQFLGPQRNGAVDVEIASDWTTKEPQLIWRNDEFGAGWSGFAAVNGYAVTLEQRGEKELVTCYEVLTGDLKWSHAESSRHQTVPGGVGPRSTPTIYNGRVYSLGATGILLCLDGSTGELIWKRELLRELGTTPEEDIKLVAWGRSASPLIDQGRVIVPLGLAADGDGGLEGASLIALDAVNGEEIWRKGRHQVSYASPTVMTLAGVRQIVMVCENEVCGHDADSGDELWRHPWLGSSSGNASCSQPIDAGRDRVFLSKGYAHGSALIEVKRNGAQWSVAEVWHHLTVMKTKFTNAVLFEGHVYGLDDSILSCVNLETGKRMWKRGRYGHGQVLRAGEQLLVQAESGEVALVALDPREFRQLARFDAVSGKTWNNPCLYGNYLLVRNAEQAACYLLP